MTKSAASGTCSILPPEGRRLAPVHLFSSQGVGLSPAVLAAIERIAELPAAVQVVALPDLHIKSRLETPSSTATALRDAIALGLSSPSPGCGMALAVTPLGANDLSEGRLDELFAYLARRLPIDRTGHTPFVQDVRPLLMNGAIEALDHYNLDLHILPAFERDGNAFRALPTGWPVDDALATVPEMLLPLAAQEFGGIGRGNHFLEVQVVEEVLDPALAGAWGLQPEQVVVMYHADSGRLGAAVGRFYAFRRKNTWRGRWMEARYKTRFHLSRARSVGEGFRRAAYYFAPRHHSVMPADSPLAREALLALAAATNYAFANRVAILAALRDGLRVVCGSQLPAPNLLYDVTHNGIQSEQIDEQMMWVHRHNASRALPPGHPELAHTPFSATGQPLLLPGTNRTSSYVCAARPGSAASLYSVDHGAGRTAARLGRELPRAPGVTRLYDYRQGFSGQQAHLSDHGLQEVLDVLERSDLATPVVRLRPLAVLKDLTR